METRGACPRLVWLRQDYSAGLIQGDVHTELEVDGARWWTDYLPWSHVEGGDGVRELQLALIEGLRRKSSESRSLLSGKSE